MKDCIFCRIASKEIPAKVVFEDDDVVGFEDLNPQAPTHTLVIPKRHLATLNEVDSENRDLIGKVVSAAVRIARDKGLADDGYRLVANCQENAGQSVFHIHFHLLGGRPFGWPPG
jgi:histidine triad (HIT) family protein